jgi:hypothetical protein
MPVLLRVNLDITLKPIIAIRLPQKRRLSGIHTLHRPMRVLMCLEAIVTICFAKIGGSSGIEGWGRGAVRIAKGFVAVIGVGFA